MRTHRPTPMCMSGIYEAGGRHSHSAYAHTHSRGLAYNIGCRCVRQGTRPWGMRNNNTGPNWAAPNQHRPRRRQPRQRKKWKRNKIHTHTQYTQTKCFNETKIYYNIKIKIRKITRNIQQLFEMCNLCFCLVAFRVHHEFNFVVVPFRWNRPNETIFSNRCTIFAMAECFWCTYPIPSGLVVDRPLRCFDGPAIWWISTVIHNFNGILGLNSAATNRKRISIGLFGLVGFFSSGIEARCVPGRIQNISNDTLGKLILFEMNSCGKLSSVPLFAWGEGEGGVWTLL